MSNKFEDYSLELIYQWDLVDIQKGDKTILSPMLQFCGAQSFRVGVNIEKKEASLFFLETNLNKMGLKVVHVCVRELFSMEPYNHDPNSGDINCCTLWKMEHTTRLKNTRSFTFHIYIAGIVNGYRVQRLDSHFTENFKSSALNPLKDFADFEIISRGAKFQVHQFILAARSPVFATLLRDRSNRRHIDGIDSAKLEIDCVDSATVDQFLRFLYTGELAGPINNSSQLLQLATAYQIKTLQDLCVAASSSITRDQMAEMALTMVKSESDKPSTEIRPDTIKPEVDFQSNAVILQYVWNFKWTDEFDNIENSSEAFHYQGEPMFRAKIRKSGEIESSITLDQEFTLTFLSFNHNQIGCKIDEVLYCRDWQDHDWATQTKMLERPTNHESILQTFAHTDVYASQFNLKFYVKMVSSVTNFGYRIVDTLWKDQLWTAAVEKQFTDVEFLVGDKSLGAHRFLLSAVSPVFAAMFQSGMEEALTGKVRIGDVDPGTFKHFLEFLYTGRVETAAKKEELLAVADKYQVETLVHLCKLATEPENMEDITEAFFAC